MGLEAKHTTIAIDGQTHAGDALLETSELFVRVEGEPKRRKLALSSLKKVRGESTTLSFDHAGRHYAIEVSGAKRWAHVPMKDTQLVVVGITTKAELGVVKKARAAVGDGLALWIVYAKGTKVLSEDHVRAAAIAAGLVDVKVARFSDARSALKLVVRKSERAR